MSRYSAGKLYGKTGPALTGTGISTAGLSGSLRQKPMCSALRQTSRTVPMLRNHGFRDHNEYPERSSLNKKKEQLLLGSLFLFSHSSLTACQRLSSLPVQIKCVHHMIRFRTVISLCSRCDRNILFIPDHSLRGETQPCLICKSGFASPNLTFSFSTVQSSCSLNILLRSISPSG